MNGLSTAWTQRLHDAGQDHLIRNAAALSVSEAEEFARSLAAVDWDELTPLIEVIRRGASSSSNVATWVEQAESPQNLVRQPTTEAEHQSWRDAEEAGRDELKSGRVAAVVVAGGQGTRLGFDHPKGMFPIGPVSEKTLFQGFAEQIQARREMFGAAIPYAVMTSAATDAATRAHWRDRQYYGLPADSVSFFQQGDMPAVELETGRLLLAGPDRLALSPDGHGGMLAAMRRLGLLEAWRAAGIEQICYHQVDNPATDVCDPAFLGFHTLHGSQASTKVVAKSHPDERMGVVVETRGVTRILEYSDLSAEDVRRVDACGRPIFWAGNTAMHIFQLDFLAKMAEPGRRIDFHIARKVVPHWNPHSSTMDTPAQPNAAKFERFLFDVLPAANRTLVMQVDRAREFLPVKNRDGADSPASVRAALVERDRRRLTAMGAAIDDGVMVEISPRFAVDDDQLRARIAPGTRYSANTCLDSPA